MSNLFILGNGFDLAHCLRTKYSHFEKHLYKKYPEILNEPNLLLNPQIMPDGSESYDIDEVVSFLVDIISKTESSDEKWSDLEQTLGSLDYSELIDTLSTITEDEKNLWNKANVFEDAINNLYIPMNEIKQLFSTWIETISTNEVIKKPKFNKLINKESDYFITFNYTNLLQDLYKISIKQILHIHGSQGKEIILGHGNINRTFELYPSGSEFGLLKIHKSLKKDTDKVIYNNTYFFEKLKSVKNIYSYGFSFSEVDLIYIREILKHIKNKDLIWHLSDYNNEKEREDIQNVIKNYGFEGSFRVFNI